MGDVGGGLQGQVGLDVTHRPNEVPELLPVGLDLLLQDVVLGDLLLQLRHARPVPALADLLLQESRPLSSASGLGLCLSSLCPHVEDWNRSYGQRVDRPAERPRGTAARLPGLRPEHLCDYGP